MQRVVIVVTDGMVTLRDTLTMSGAVPALKGDGLLGLLPADVSFSFEEFGNLPGSHMIPAQALDLSRRVATLLADEDVRGVVVTHGSDTLEETAYLLDITLESAKPVVVTPAARGFVQSGYDSVRNLADALRVAAHPAARGCGVLAVAAGEIHAAGQVMLLDGGAVPLLHSPLMGAVGRVRGGDVHIGQQPRRGSIVPAPRLVETVDLIRVTQGGEDRQLRHCITDGVAGVVLEVLGSGRVPPWWLPAIGEAVSQRMSVVVTARTLVGTLGDEYAYVGAYHDLRRLGVLFAPDLPGVKARIRLMLALGVAHTPAGVRQWFTADSHGG